MKIVIFGATGGTGQELVRQALSKGYDVFAFVRSPQKLKIKSDKLRLVKGDVRTIADVRDAIKECQAVISALGVRLGKPICEEGTKNIIAEMKSHKVKRLIVESAFGAGETKSKAFYARCLWILIKSMMLDKDRMEEAIKKSNLDWVIVRPTALTNGPMTKKYRVGHDLNLTLYPKISRADVANFMLEQLTSDKHLHKTPTIIY